MSDPTTALVELVANSWDAYATEVKITWPESASNTPFEVSDNGVGMTRAEFETRWRTLDYNRSQHQGGMTAPPPELEGSQPRQVYGQNGRGRHAAFFFSPLYRVRTWRDGAAVTFRVSQGRESPIELELLAEEFGVEGHGTSIIGESVVPSTLRPEEVRSLLSTRFLLDPSFMVVVDGVQVTFSDIPSDAVDELEVEVGVSDKARLIVIDSQRSDRTTKQHGIAWWVNRRLVGRPNWGAYEGKFVDGRTEEAKRYSFVVHVDFLRDAVRADWSGFDRNSQAFLETQERVHEAIADVISRLLRERRKETREKVAAAHEQDVRRLPWLSQDRWNRMLTVLVEKCPTLGEKHLDQVMGLLVTLERAESQCALLDKLHKFSPEDADSWNEILGEWTARTAKIALDEIAKRLKLIEEIRIKTELKTTSEVQELQPLFGQALWIFGPEFETIEFTSNRGMTAVIRDLFGGHDRGSLSRPDFVVLPKSTIGVYARPSFDTEHNENGIESVVIVELKKPGVPIGNAEKSQVWAYVKELKQRGHIRESTTVTGFVLGDRIEPGENGATSHGDRVQVRPVLYGTFIGQAEKRMMNLHRRLSEAPFIQAILNSENSALPTLAPIQFEMSVSSEGAERLVG